MDVRALDWKTRSLRLVLAAALLCGCVGSGYAVPCTADANGDQAVDVRDMQAVVAAVLAGEAPRVADVNRDGAVDVLDLQLIVSAVEQAAPLEPAAPEGEAPAVVPRAVVLTVLPTAVPSLVDHLVAEPPAPCVADRETGFYRTNQWRYALCLTPHAPPCPG